MRALEQDNQRLSNLLNVTPQTPYTAEMSDDDLGEQDYQIAQEWARRGKAAQEAVNQFVAEAKLAQMREQVKKRPANYAKLSAEQKWQIDGELGILDYEGN